MPVHIRRPSVINRWPKGAQRVSCLGCERPFISAGKHIRFCDWCRGYIARGLPPVTGQRQAFLDGLDQ